MSTSTNQPVTSPLPKTAHHVSREEVARYYIRCELANVVKGEFELAMLGDKQLWRMLQALSYTYRLNSVFSLTTDEGYDWYSTELPIKDVTLTGMSLAINKVIADVEHDPIRFAAHLKEYFEQHPHDDPAELNELRPRPIPDDQTTVIVREKEGKILMVDGSHRLITTVMQGGKNIRAYYAKPNGMQNKPMIGDSTLVILCRLFEKAETDTEKRAILNVAKQLIAQSSDAREAVALYWQWSGAKPETIEAAKKLLES